MKKSTFLLLIAFCISIPELIQSQTVSTQKQIYPPGENIIVNYSGFPGNPKDWIGVVPASYPDEQGSQWFFTDGKTSGTMTFGGLPSGTYEVRGYFNNDYIVRSRYKFTVGNSDPNAVPKAITEKNNYAATEKITVNYSGFPGNPKDWLAIAPVGYKDDQASYWYFTDGKQSGAMPFPGLPEGTYEVRGYFNNTYEVKSRYQFTVSNSGSNTTNTNTTNTVKGIPSTLCRRELSTFYAGIGGLGSAWGRAATEPLTMNPGAVADMQAVIGNAKAALEMVKCVPFDVKKIDALNAKLPSLTNVQAVAEIEATIKEIQAAVAMVKLDCGNGSTLMSLYIVGIHMGAAQAWASSRMCQPAPMPASIQTVIMNHLQTAQNAFADFLPCVPGYPLSSITSVPVGSANSVEPHIAVIMQQSLLLWNIALSDCCCSCK